MLVIKSTGLDSIGSRSRLSEDRCTSIAITQKSYGVWSSCTARFATCVIGRSYSQTMETMDSYRVKHGGVLVPTGTSPRIRHAGDASLSGD